jgi:hypothetical protein
MPVGICAPRRLCGRLLHFAGKRGRNPAQQNEIRFIPGGNRR